MINDYLRAIIYAFVLFVVMFLVEIGYGFLIALYNITAYGLIISIIYYIVLLLGAILLLSGVNSKKHSENILIVYYALSWIYLVVTTSLMKLITLLISMFAHNPYSFRTLFAIPSTLGIVLFLIFPFIYYKYKKVFPKFHWF